MEIDVDNREAIRLSHYPDFSELGYEVIRELGRNQVEGRITYLAQVCKSHQQVVIKEFNCASTTADWSGLRTYEREIEILQQLDHPRIPRYINSFEMPEHFYLVEEYKNAPSLGLGGSFKPEEIKQIAISILEILVYLQQRADPIIHRDIKPENILVDEHLNAYLVDFDLARLEKVKMALSSFVSGTPGFIPPEEQLGHPLTQASDLYSLGVTLICLLTDTRSVDICQVMNCKYGLNFLKLVPQLNPRFKLWLMKLVKCQGKYRYANAFLALKALGSIQVTGNDHTIDTLFAAIKLRQRTVVLCLAMISIIAAGTTTLILSRTGGVAKQMEIIKSGVGSGE
ncbi:serine/threonine protein kinase [Nodularia sphaerocarpa]|uniref:serine/threonine protein kinase n=1 Tax=Nodularia sphaerocarpa TaxID=137816 RepID=UPI001EFAC141|nr:serine/threonine-protein kinase [Nodularia sphaerocarpa]MDB9375090.1 serine/threonine-protein kinase [Nodularia sphaerocarpa CS-585]ULP73297.1 Serine/threonine-protein kinase B [Nodularia sphaerocarpa UHCC 0038]